MSAVTFTWTATSSGNWGTASNWSSSAPTDYPGQNSASDVAILSGTNTYTLTFNETTDTIATLTISDPNAILTFASGDVLTATGVTTVTNGTIDITTSEFISSQLKVGTSSGTLLLSGGTLDLTGSAGNTLTTGGTETLSGGTFTAPKLTISGGTFTEEGAAISIAGPVAISGGTDAVSSGTLAITGAANALTISGTNLTLGGTITAAISNDTGSTLGSGQDIVMSTGSFLDFTNASGGITNSGTIVGAGKVTGTLAGSGTIDASGGTLTLTTALPASSSLTFDIANSASSVLDLGAKPGNSETFTFLGSAGTLALASAASITESVVGLHVGSNLTPTNAIDLLGTIVTISTGAKVTGSATTDTVTLSNGDSLSLSGVTNPTSTWFVNAASDGSGGTDIFLSAICYAAGTRILTATGERMVESLLRGDIVLTLSDGELNAQPVKWIGRRRIDLAAHPRPETVAPIRIQRGAFADTMPHSDLLVSPDHAIFVDGKLICARQLVNGTTIRQEKGRTSVDYFHVELDAHAILLAEGLPAESYLNTGNRGFFANSGEPLVLHPDLTDEADYPTREAASCAPFVWDEGSVRPVWQRLADRAAALGQPAPQLDTTADPALHVVAKGRKLRPLYGENGLYIFALPKGATEVRVVSRAGAPTDVRPWLEDRRCLGVYVERIILRNASELREVPVDHPDLSDGWWAVEQNGTAMRRWTNGDAGLSLPAIHGPSMLEIRASTADMTYVVAAEAEIGRQAA